MIAELLLENYQDVPKIRKVLSQIKDIEKLCRQVVLHFAIIYVSFVSIICVCLFT